MSTTVRPGVLSVPAEVHGRCLQAMSAEALRLTDEVLSSGVFHGGPRVRELEGVTGRLWGGHPVGASSGTMALEAACRALGIGAGDEVIVPALTFVSTSVAPAHTGAVPVVADIDPLTRTLDAEAVRAAITSRTKAVIAVHMYGQCADMTALNAIAGHHGLAPCDPAHPALCRAVRSRIAHAPPAAERRGGPYLFGQGRWVLF
ncbi:aminotransferase class I/II-fold pyridoxal phosphate-dependent enzyme [Streptomyces sp. NPDC002755]|uniref:aminotransferase class I/II-fold pyridoxal phosphate-dependent enzyme n=1 Tax=Streptomyces sp. NPDC002884 TaxID=3154544 RepID=UPI003326AFDD